MRPATSVLRSGAPPAPGQGGCSAPAVAELTAGVTLLRELTKGQQCPAVASMFNLRIENPGKPAVPTRCSIIPIGCTGSPDAIANSEKRLYLASATHSRLSLLEAGS